MSAMRISVVIATKDRPDDLKECIESIFNQTELPDEVVIVDSSKDNRSYKVVQRFNLSSGVKPFFRYFHTSKQSSTFQRNMGVEVAKGNIIHFIDDDVILEPDYLRQINAIYRNDSTGEIAGVGGLIIRDKRTVGRGFLIDLFKKIFLLSNDNGDGRMLRSGWALMQFRKNTSKISSTELLQGCCSYRKEILSKYKFDENLSGHAVREDIDLAFRISRKHKLIYTPFAKLYHKASTTGRESEEIFYQKYIYNHFYIFRKNMKGSIINWLCFWWSEIGSMLGIIFLSFRKKSVKPLKGALSGYFLIGKDLVSTKRSRS